MGDENIVEDSKMRSQPPSMISIQEDPLDSSKNVGSILSTSSSPISSSESGITINRQRISPTSKCAIWKQKNENQFSNSSSLAVIEANNRNKLKSGKGTTGESDSPTHKLESNVVLQDVLSIKSYLHKLSRILQAEDEPSIESELHASLPLSTISMEDSNVTSEKDNELAELKRQLSILQTQNAEKDALIERLRIELDEKKKESPRQEKASKEHKLESSSLSSLNRLSPVDKKGSNSLSSSRNSSSSNVDSSSQNSLNGKKTNVVKPVRQSISSHSTPSKTNSNLSSTVERLHNPVKSPRERNKSSTTSRSSTISQRISKTPPPMISPSLVTSLSSPRDKTNLKTLNQSCCQCKSSKNSSSTAATQTVNQNSPTSNTRSSSNWKVQGSGNNSLSIYSPSRESRADSASIHSASSSRSSSTSDRLCRLRRSRTPMTHNYNRPPITPVIRSSEDGTLRISIKSTSIATYTTEL